MSLRFAPVAWLAPTLAWSLLALAAASEGSAGCSTSDPASDAAVALFVLGGIAAVGGLVLNVWPFRAGWDVGALGGGIALAAVGVAALGLALLPLLLVVLLFGVWRIAAGDARGGRRTHALLAYLASSLWFPAAGIALLWAALRCFTF